MSRRAIALLLAASFAIATTACATTYEGARDRAALGGIAFGAGTATWLAGITADNQIVAVSGVAIATVGMALVAAGGVGMVHLPRRVVVALELARDLIDAAKRGGCDVVVARMHEVEDLDFVVYEVVLVQDADVSKCLGSSI